MRIFQGIIGLFCVSVLTVHADQYQQLVRRYEKQIHEQELQLKRIRRDLKMKDLEAMRWRSRASTAQQLWEDVGQERASNERQLKKIQTTVDQIQKNASSASTRALQLHAVDDSTRNTLREQVREYYKKHLAFSAPTMQEETDGTVYFLHRALTRMAGVTQTAVLVANQQLFRLRNEHTVWNVKQKKTMSQWARLKEEQEDQWAKWQHALKRKEILTEERNQLEQSAQALRVVLAELRRERDQARGVRPSSTELDRAYASMKGTFPWPARGKVVQSYGRSVSSELNQLTVSNGIRIQAKPMAEIRAVQSGTVLYARSFQQYGQLVIVQHQNGLTSVYGGLGSIAVQERSTVGALQTLGTSDASGRFYFEFRREERPINPLTLLVAQGNGAS